MDLVRRWRKAWQATCPQPSHNTTKTKRTKTMSFKPGMEETVLASIKEWCDCAEDYPDKAAHQAYERVKRDRPVAEAKPKPAAADSKKMPKAKPKPRAKASSKRKRKQPDEDSYNSCQTLLCSSFYLFNSCAALNEWRYRKQTIYILHNETGLC